MMSSNSFEGGRLVPKANVWDVARKIVEEIQHIWITLSAPAVHVWLPAGTLDL